MLAATVEVVSITAARARYTAALAEEQAAARKYSAAIEAFQRAPSSDWAMNLVHLRHSVWAAQSEATCHALAELDSLMRSR